MSWVPGEILTPDAPIICAKMENISRTIRKKIDYRGRTYCDDTLSRSCLEKFIILSTNPFIPVLPTFLMIVGVTTRTPRILKRKTWSYNVFAAHAIYLLRSYIPSQLLNDKRAYVITASYEPPVICIQFLELGKRHRGMLDRNQRAEEISGVGVGPER